MVLGIILIGIVLIANIFLIVSQIKLFKAISRRNEIIKGLK